MEAKFGHQVTTGQLPTYREFIRKNVNPTNNYALILLTYTGEKDTRNQEWQPKSWLVLMTHWERNLTEDHDIGFSFLRQFIWNKLRIN